jgi:hypothetical protein
MKISKAKATEIIKNSRGKFITVVFDKKNGEERTLTGEGLKYNPDDYGLVGIYDNINKGYRMVNLNTLKEVTAQKTTYEVE